jgi:carotenoid cleavage dioxygenase
VFEAQAIAEGPIATIQIPIQMRFGLHGNWAEAADIGLAA